MQKAIGYIRVSTQGQADEGVSLDAHRAKIAAWCSLNDAKLVTVFEDVGISGVSINRRGGLPGALQSTSAGGVGFEHQRIVREVASAVRISPAECPASVPWRGLLGGRRT